MFGGRRRRSPLVGAALIAGTATVAARHGARKQSQTESERRFQMEQEAELRRYAEERNQRAIDQAVNDALAKQQAGNSGQAQPAPASGPGAAPVIMQPPPGAPPLYGATDPYGSPSASSPYLHPSQAAAFAPPRPRSTSAADSGICFCSDCGSKCGAQDNFCSRCGRSLSSGAYERPEKQGM